MQRSVAERLKLGLLAEGIRLDDSALAYVARANGDRSLTPADYASTSGIILRLEQDTWVNAPIAGFNPNFVTAPAYTLTCGESGLVVDGRGMRAPAAYWLQPAYHGKVNPRGEAYNSYVFTHADRVRISPIEGCAFTCRFCDLPYEYRYRTKSTGRMLDAVRVALSDPIQPAHHILISGGTPRPEDYGYVRDIYEAVLTTFPDVPVDIMMVPLHEVLDVERLASLGLAEVSINMEVWGEDAARRLTPRKHKQGRQHYLDYLEESAAVLGGIHVRSMLMLGLEDPQDTLAGVEAIASRGCVPVLSPFRPDPSTPLRDWPVPDVPFLEQVYDEARSITESHGVPLGPSCIPCSHNTLSFAASGTGDAARYFGHPNMV